MLTKLLALLTVFAFGVSKGFAKSCVDFYYTSEADIRSKLKKLVTTYDYLSVARTVVFKGQTRNGLVVLERQEGMPWGSLHNPFKTGFTRHGDPRNPVLVFGPLLAQKMGFSVELQDNFTKRLFVPSSRNLSRTIKIMNRELERKGLETISYLPVSFGLATPEQILFLSVSGGEKFQMLFPYADRDKKLTVHEVSAHLSSLILPRHVFHRARVVTERNLEIIELIKKEPNLTAVSKQQVIEQIFKDRSIELDFGTGNISTFLGDFRRKFPESPFKNFSQNSDNMDPNFGFPAWVTKLTQVSMTPSASVISRLNHILGLNQSKIPIQKRDALEEIKIIKTLEGHGNQLTLNVQDIEIFKVIMEKFLKKYENENKVGFAPIDPQVYALDILNNLDRRIEDLESAASFTTILPD